MFFFLLSNFFLWPILYIFCWTISPVLILLYPLSLLTYLLYPFLSLTFLVSSCLSYHFPYNRGASLRFLPNIFVHGYYYCAAIFSILLHTLILLIRANQRKSNGHSHPDRMSHIGGVQAYSLLDWPLWISALFLFPLGGIFSSIAINKYDGTAYRRYLQYLRLEFDTRLGMHSPR